MSTKTKKANPTKARSKKQAAEPVTLQSDATSPASRPEGAAAPKVNKAKGTRARKAAAKTRGLSALDAAAQVLAEEGRAMNCPELIVAMAAKGYWSSPAGKTPAATLHAAISREVATKGTQARFVKTERGKFALRDATA